MGEFFSRFANWTDETWGSANLNDKRLNKRAVKLSEQILENPEASIPKQMGAWKDIKAAYRLFNSPKVTHKTLQKQHNENVKNEAAAGENNIILFIQDGSELDFSSHRKTLDLGPIGNHKGIGIMLHTTLAVRYHIHEINVLGLAKQYAWVRKAESYSGKETRTERNLRDNEGDYWIKSLESIKIPPKLSNTWVNVGDRGNDMFRFLSFCNLSGWNYVVRGSHDRKICDLNDKEQHLKQYARTLLPQAEKVLELRARNKKPARIANLKVSWGKVLVLPPQLKGKEPSRKAIPTWVIRCWEDSDNIEEDDKLEWFLLTNFEINTVEDALEKISWYESRWIIEEYHKSLKTGCSMEKRQLKTTHRLMALLGFLGVIATKILEIKYITRRHPDELAQKYVPLTLLKIICIKSQARIDLITMRQFWHNTAKLGGFIGRKSDGEPGWQTLWSGWLRLFDMYIGAMCMDVERCG